MKWKELKKILDAMTPAELGREASFVSREFNLCCIVRAAIAEETMYSDGEEFYSKEEIKGNGDNVSDYDLVVKKGCVYITV